MLTPEQRLDLQQAGRSAIMSAPRQVLFQALSDVEALPSNVHAVAGQRVLRTMARRQLKDDDRRTAFLARLSLRLREFTGQA